MTARMTKPTDQTLDIMKKPQAPATPMMKLEKVSMTFLKNSITAEFLHKCFPVVAVCKFVSTVIFSPLVR